MDKFFIAKTLILLNLIIVLALLAWAFMAKPKKEIRSQYSIFNFVRIMLPFYHDWKRLVLSEHLEIISIYRFRVHRFMIVSVILYFIFSLYVLIF